MGAERIAAKLMTRTSSASAWSPAWTGTKQSEYAEVQLVDVNTLELVNPRCLGVEKMAF